MKIAIVENNNVKKVGELQDLFPDTSFPSNGPSQEWMASNNVLGVNLYKPYNALTQKLTACDPVIEDGYVYLVSIVALTDAEIQENKTIAMEQLRQERNRLLDESDKTQTLDAANRFDQPAWAAYRQLLADFPATIEDARLPYTFPTAPTN